ncbi:MAG: type II toxin-antitoxin system VapC family toxin [Micrococcales bacterium]|nr:type II toxin-antitoxin system VapC family toxin [Micrococcales bacterium]
MIVVDASVALAWCFEDEATPDTDSILVRVRRNGGVVPSLWVVETSNALVTAWRRSRITDAVVQRLLALLGALPLEKDPDQPGHAELVAVAQLHGLTTYDAAYLALAQSRGLPLATLDGKLAEAAARAGVVVLPSAVASAEAPDR